PGTNRCATGRGLSHYLHPCACCLDVHVYLSGHRLLGSDRTVVQYPVVVPARASFSAHWCHVLRTCTLDRRTVGQANLGGLLGMGCTHHFATAIAIPVPGLHRSHARYRNPTPS